MSNYKEIDTSKWVRKGIYEWFKEFSNPAYTFNCKIDVDELVKYSKETNTSFFINFLYIISRVNNEIEGLRLRYIDNKVYLYDYIDPTFTIKTKDNSFNNGYVKYTSDYNKFYKETKKEINSKCLKSLEGNYNPNNYDVFYSSCLTTIEVEALTQPLNIYDKNSLNVPRIFWDKYRLENNRYVIMLSFTVSHILMDGEELSKAINLVKKYCLEFKDIIK